MSSRKNYNIFPCSACLLFVVDQMILKMALFQAIFPALKNFLLNQEFPWRTDFARGSKIQESNFV